MVWECFGVVCCLFGLECFFEWVCGVVGLVDVVVINYVLLVIDVVVELVVLLEYWLLVVDEVYELVDWVILVVVVELMFVMFGMVV